MTDLPMYPRETCQYNTVPSQQSARWSLDPYKFLAPFPDHSKTIILYMLDCFPQDHHQVLSVEGLYLLTHAETTPPPPEIAPATILRCPLCEALLKAHFIKTHLMVWIIVESLHDLQFDTLIWSTEDNFHGPVLDLCVFSSHPITPYFAVKLSITVQIL